MSICQLTFTSASICLKLIVVLQLNNNRTKHFVLNSISSYIPYLCKVIFFHYFYINCSDTQLKHAGSYPSAIPCQLQHFVYYLSPCVIYLPRPFSPPFLSERGLCSAAESYQPLYQRQRSTQRQQGAKLCVLVFGCISVCGWVFRDASIAPRCCVHDGGEWWRDGGENAINMNIHRAWATSCTAY